jgi:5'-nucleotidase / UDP-sugar diphosphatase
VPEGSPFYPYIRRLACRGIVSGYRDSTFRPGNDITRGQVAKMVSNAAGASDPIPADRQTYADAPGANPFWLWIERLTLRRAIGGYACGGQGEPCLPPGNRPYFRPSKDATRAQLSKIVVLAAGGYPSPTGQIFEDVPTTHIFYDWVEPLAEAGAISGYQCGAAGEPCLPPANRSYFRPYNHVTRGQAAKIVANAFFPDRPAPVRKP